MTKVYVGSIGLPFNFMIGSPPGTVGTTERLVHVRKPDGSTATWICDTLDDARITYKTVLGDLPVKGDYYFYPEVAWADGRRIPGETAVLHVYDYYE